MHCQQLNALSEASNRRREPVPPVHCAAGERAGSWGKRGTAVRAEGGGGGSEVAGAAASITTASPLSLSSPLFSLFLFLFLFPSLFPSFYLSLPLSLSLSSYIFIFLAGRGWPVGGASG